MFCSIGYVQEDKSMIDDINSVPGEAESVAPQQHSHALLIARLLLSSYDEFLKLRRHDTHSTPIEDTGEHDEGTYEE
jgi:hypothetical protein